MESGGGEQPQQAPAGRPAVRLASEATGDHGGTRPLLAACGTVCHVPCEFFAQCDTLMQLAQDTEGNEEPVPVQASAEDLATVLRLVERWDGEWGLDHAAVACHVAAFLGHHKLSQYGVSTLATAVASADNLNGLVAESDRLPARLQAAVSAVLQVSDTPPTAASIAEVIDLIAECGVATSERVDVGDLAGRSEQPTLHLEQLDSDVLLTLLSSLDFRKCLSLMQSSHTVCSIVYAKDFKYSFRAWSAVLQHPTLTGSGEGFQPMSVVDQNVIDELNKDAAASISDFSTHRV